MTGRAGILAALRVAADDLVAVGLDMIEPPRRRKLGALEHHRLHAEAREKLAGIIAELDADERGDPAGSGGAGGE